MGSKFGGNFKVLKTANVSVEPGWTQLYLVGSGTVSSSIFDQSRSSLHDYVLLYGSSEVGYFWFGCQVRPTKRGHTCFMCVCFFSMIETTQLYQTRPMPVCTYEVLRNGLNGPVMRFAQVGEMAFHKWSCQGGKIQEYSAVNMLLCVHKTTFWALKFTASGCRKRSVLALRFPRISLGPWPVLIAS